MIQSTAKCSATQALSLFRSSPPPVSLFPSARFALPLRPFLFSAQAALLAGEPVLRGATSAPASLSPATWLPLGRSGPTPGAPRVVRTAGFRPGAAVAAAAGGRARARGGTEVRRGGVGRGVRLEELKGKGGERSGGEGWGKVRRGEKHSVSSSAVQQQVLLASVSQSTSAPPPVRPSQPGTPLMWVGVGVALSALRLVAHRILSPLLSVAPHNLLSVLPFLFSLCPAPLACNANGALPSLQGSKFVMQRMQVSSGANSLFPYLSLPQPHQQAMMKQMLSAMQSGGGGPGGAANPFAAAGMGGGANPSGRCDGAAQLAGAKPPTYQCCCSSILSRYPTFSLPLSPTFPPVSCAAVVDVAAQVSDAKPAAAAAAAPSSATTSPSSSSSASSSSAASSAPAEEAESSSKKKSFFQDAELVEEPSGGGFSWGNTGSSTGSSGSNASNATWDTSTNSFANGGGGGECSCSAQQARYLPEEMRDPATFKCMKQSPMYHQQQLASTQSLTFHCPFLPLPFSFPRAVSPCPTPMCLCMRLSPPGMMQSPMYRQQLESMLTTSPVFPLSIPPLCNFLHYLFTHLVHSIHLLSLPITSLPFSSHPFPSLPLISSHSFPSHPLPLIASFPYPSSPCSDNMGGTGFDDRVLDMMKSFDLNSPEVKDQFSQLGMSPEDVVGKIMSNPKLSSCVPQLGMSPEDVVGKIMSNPKLAAAFQNPRLQAAILDVSPLVFGHEMAFQASQMSPL
ncbi:unnamed protein product [Closterium sp. NIES-65]|nr:unnamed protein product [Closterium sp. NIES-65]